MQLATHTAPRLYPADTDRFVRVHLDIIHAAIDLGHDKKYVGPSFERQIPGPSIRLRVGDRLRLSLSNLTAEAVAGLSFPGGKHTIVTEGLLVAHADEAQSIAPGETFEFDLTAMKAGVFLYRGGPVDKPDAHAAGLFGMLVVDPPTGPPEVETEIAVVESELFAKADVEGRQIDGKPVYLFDSAALASKTPSLVSFNGGRSEQIAVQPEARVGIYLLNASLSREALISVADLPFADRAQGPVKFEPGKGGRLQVSMPKKKGAFRIVDELRPDPTIGPLAALDSTGGEIDPAEMLRLEEERNRNLTPAQRLEKAKGLFSQRCVTCHNPPAGMMRLAPDLAGVTKRRTPEWLAKWLANPPKMQATDPTAMALLAQWKNVSMPDMMLTPMQIGWMLELLNTL